MCGSFYASHVGSCTYCFEAGTVMRAGTRATAAIDAEPEVTTAHALAMASWSMVECPAYPELRLGRGALAVLSGPPSQGKSTATTILLNSIPGAVVLQSVEESVGPSLFARFARCGVRRPDFFVVGRASVDQLAECVRSRRAVALGIDSVQVASYDAADLRHLLLVLPELRLLVAVAQVNKQGRIEGRERLLHEADVAIECKEMRWHLVKSRYQPVGISGDVLPKEPTNANP